LTNLHKYCKVPETLLCQSTPQIENTMRALPVFAIAYALFILAVTEPHPAHRPTSFTPTNVPDRAQWIRINPGDALRDGYDHVEHGGRGTHAFYRFP
jgi:hypothetical protein